MELYRLHQPRRHTVESCISRHAGLEMDAWGTADVEIWPRPMIGYQPSWCASRVSTCTECREFKWRQTLSRVLTCEAEKDEMKMSIVEFVLE